MKEIVAYVFGFGMLINAALFVPQAWRIWKTKAAEGVSVLTFAGFNALQVTGVLHGYMQGDHALMTGMFASLLTCGAVTLLAAYYGRAARTAATQEG
jgi:MtN3 and saliva related transmembrane protein